MLLCWFPLCHGSAHQGPLGREEHSFGSWDYILLPPSKPPINLDTQHFFLVVLIFFMHIRAPRAWVGVQKCVTPIKISHTRIQIVAHMKMLFWDFKLTWLILKKKELAQKCLRKLRFSRSFSENWKSKFHAVPENSKSKFRKLSKAFSKFWKIPTQRDKISLISK